MDLIGNTPLVTYACFKHLWWNGEHEAAFEQMSKLTTHLVKLSELSESSEAGLIFKMLLPDGNVISALLTSTIYIRRSYSPKRWNLSAKKSCAAHKHLYPLNISKATHELPGCFVLVQI